MTSFGDSLGDSLGVNLVIICSFISEYLFRSSLIKTNYSWFIQPSSIAFETRLLMVLSLLSARTLISSCFCNYLVISLLRANLNAITVMPNPMATHSSMNPTGAATTGAATTVAMLAIPIDPAAIPPPSAIVSTMDNVVSILLYTIPHAHFSLRKFLFAYR